MTKNSFRFKIACYYLTASLLAIMLLSGVIYMAASHIFVKETVSKTQMAIEVSANRIGELLHYKKSLLELYASNQTIQSFASGNEALREQIIDQIDAIQQSDAAIFGVFLSLDHGETLTSNQIPFWGNPQSIDLGTPCLTRERIKHYPHDDPWTVTLAVPILDENQNQLGILGLDLDYCLFSHTLKHLDLGENNLILMKDTDGTLVFDSSKRYEKEPSIEQLLSNQAQNGFDPKNNTLIYHTPIPNTDWEMAGILQLDGLRILKRQLFDMVVFTALILSLALAVITILVSRRLTDPISRLVKGMEDIQQLTELSVHEDEISETAILTASYNRMIQKIKELMHQLEQKQEALRNAEFAALTSQINPHFLYNTLDTIVWLAEFRDNERIISLTKSLAAFFRLSLNEGKSTVSLQDEIDHVKQYLLIQKERYGSKFDYSFHIEEAVLGYPVPKIILQPIVENAIYHGIKPMDANGQIDIKAQRRDSFLILSVSDNGVGFDAANKFHTIKKASGGVGLKNIEQRIKLFYGEHTALQIHSTEQGTQVELQLDISNLQKEEKDRS